MELSQVGITVQNKQNITYSFLEKHFVTSEVVIGEQRSQHPDGHLEEVNVFVLSEN